MRLSHKRKLLHKKGIPQRAWIGRKNRELLRWNAKVNFAAVNGVHGNFKSGWSGYRSVWDGLFSRAIWRRKKRTGEVVWNVREMMLRGLKRSSEKQSIEVQLRNIRSPFFSYASAANLAALDLIKKPTRLPASIPVFKNEVSQFDMPDEVEGEALLSMLPPREQTYKPVVVIGPTRIRKTHMAHEAVLNERLVVSQTALAEKAKEFGKEGEDAMTGFSKALMQLGGTIKGKLASIFKKNRSL
ncbi:hypothetical protein NB491_00260 [Vibrio alginolyticus]|uniref:hypothetical protein n=1 Tax=Vibrio alginolyticus TaxID=663 RepID=UPI00215CC136|nr:hypothetical protein [Vibrio alginolyticus]MCR9634422.1 hypothetical protein [Vibrio alginolyticus]